MILAAIYTIILILEESRVDKSLICGVPVVPGRLDREIDQSTSEVCGVWSSTSYKQLEVHWTLYEAWNFEE